MMNNNKILTVYYGTFSCTLEGFDDSFGTMKAIAEYFRDLSADDRYFGAEPIQPDAQMLARIAEREISRQVDAREDDGRIVLSARDSAKQPTALAAPDTAPQTAPDASENEPAAPEKDIDDAAPAEQALSEENPAHEDHDTVTEDTTITEGATAETETVAEASDAIRQDVEDTPEEGRDAQDRVLDDADAEDAKEETAEPTFAEVEDAKQDDRAAAVDDDDEADEEADIVPSLHDADVEAFFAESPKTIVQDDADTDADPEPAAERAKADSIAEKLKRIRAVVSQQNAEAAAPDFSEDEHAIAASVPATPAPMAAEPDEDRSDVMAETLRDLEDALDADDEAYGAEFDTTEIDLDLGDEDEDDDVAAILSRLESDANAHSFAQDDTLDAVEEEDEEPLDAMDSLVATSAEDDLDEEGLGDDNLFEPEQAATPEQDAHTEPTIAPAPTAAPAPMVPRTRVLRVKRATLDAAIQAGQLEEYDDESPIVTAQNDAPTGKESAAKASTLSDEAEAELARELAELEADIAATKAPAQDAVPTKREQPAEQTAEASAKQAPPQDTTAADAPAHADIRGSADDDLSRLMEETDQQMHEPESATRRDAFAHLRAAVAAKKADDASGATMDTVDSDEAYRDDLADVVRPRRPVSGDRPRTQRPAEQRPAPLKLVAEQRIDVDAAHSAQPVRPRRVAAMPKAPESHNQQPDADSFADFAAEMGADKLPDLLEAAAAYLSFVEGQEQFSRPQLMNKVRQVEKENFTREDSLRSFGKLLREGKIEKLSGGRFQASDQISYKPDARAVG